MRPDYRVSCWIRLTAYYSSPLQPDETIAMILAAGEQPLSSIPFTRGSIDEDEREMSHAGHTLTWDQPGSPIPEPGQPFSEIKPVSESSPASVGDIRRSFGTVYALTLPQEDYYQVSR
ncbi:hypothetical protein ACFY93_28440 [Streptomyces sp. NPDC008313]|uniref:hypothetical protein n=1 Tax=Streptomyces sp. NPDC008313 TaxID=3364826 RepID=UPI0036E61032